LAPGTMPRIRFGTGCIQTSSRVC